MQKRHDLPCWDEDCGGTSSCSVYLDPKPHLYCFKCTQTNWNEETVEEYLSMTYDNVRPMHTHQSDFPVKGIVNPLTDRGITRETSEKFSVEQIFDAEGKHVETAFPVFKGSDVVAQKLKTPDKKMRWAGQPKDPEMFGQHLFPSGGRFLTITEGEEDAMACYQMQKLAAPNVEPAVVSLVGGASGAEKECRRHWEYINSFENVIICFDGDETGRRAAEKVAALFDFKPKIMLFPDAKVREDGKWELKDASDYLRDNKQREFIRLWWAAEKSTPKGVLTFTSLFEAMVKDDTHTTVQYPWAGLNEKLHGIHTGDLVIIKAPPKIGKTQFLREVSHHIRVTSPHNVGLIFLEDTLKSIGLGMCALEMNRPIQFPDVPCSLDELKAAHEAVSKDDRYTVFDPQDERTVENIFNKIMYFVKAMNCKFIILDHISMLAYQAGDVDERRFLDKLLADLKAMTTKHDIGILAITHVNDDGKTRGSRAAPQLCNALIALSRDKLNPDPIIANTLVVTVEENRLTGDSGEACKLFFNRETGRLTESDPDLEMAVGDRKVQFDA